MARKRQFGEVTKLPSKRWRARYTGPDGLRHSAPHTFDTKKDADAWLTLRQSEVITGEWRTDKAQPMTFGEYARVWLERRELKPRTRELYQSLLDQRLLPTFSSIRLNAIDNETVAAWYHRQGRGTPTALAHAYSLLRTILGDAERAQHIQRNPASIRGAGNTKRQREIKPATIDELTTIVENMPSKYRLLVLLASWCGLRFGEVTELRRDDIDLANGVVKVRRAVTRVRGQHVVSTPKSTAGTRDVAIPPHLLPTVKEHLASNITGGRDGLLFPARDGVSHLPESTLYKSFRPAREAAGRPDLRFHDLRHGAAVLAAQSGATLAELMHRLGHSSPQMALRYQHVASERDRQIAARLSEMANPQGD